MQPDKLTTVKTILEKTKDLHYRAKTNRTFPRPFHTPEPLESGAALALLLYVGTGRLEERWIWVQHTSLQKQTPENL